MRVIKKYKNTATIVAIKHKTASVVWQLPTKAIVVITTIMIMATIDPISFESFINILAIILGVGGLW